MPGEFNGYQDGAGSNRPFLYMF